MKNPIEFAEGTYIQSIYTGKVYKITKFFKNGMCNLFCEDTRSNENWNTCNNAHFEEVIMGVPLVVLTLLYASR